MNPNVKLGHLGLLRVLVKAPPLYLYSHVGHVYISADLFSWFTGVYGLGMMHALAGLKVTANYFSLASETNSACLLSVTW
jgi:hypothetical protein